MTPVALERFRPFVKRPDRLRVGSIQHPPAVAPHVDKAHLEQNAQVFRNRRLFQAQRVHNLPHGPFLHCKIVQDCPPPWLRHRVESIRSCRRSCHEPTIHAHMGICKALFSPTSITPPPQHGPVCPYFAGTPVRAIIVHNDECSRRLRRGQSTFEDYHHPWATIRSALHTRLAYHRLGHSQMARNGRLPRTTRSSQRKTSSPHFSGPLL